MKKIKMAMNSTTLQALRRLLFFTTPEAAALVGGVSERSWRMWEDGTRTIKPDVIDRMQSLLQWRNLALSAARSLYDDQKTLIPESEKLELVLVWYDTIEDWMTLQGREPQVWRPHCSVIAQLCAEYGAVAVKFNGPAYSRWLSNRADSEQMRGEWAAVAK